MDKALEISRSFKYMSEDEVRFLYDQAKSISKPNPVIVNIGAGSGTSSLTLAYAHPEGERYTIDIREGSPYGGLLNERHAFRHTGLKPPIQILGNSADIGIEWLGKYSSRVDILFVDGDHENGIILDIANWFNNMAENGLMLFHDYGSPNWPMVKEYVDKLIEENHFMYELVETLISVKIENETMT